MVAASIQGALILIQEPVRGCRIDEKTKSDSIQLVLYHLVGFAPKP
jgi:hypothetical protein